VRKAVLEDTGYEDLGEGLRGKIFYPKAKKKRVKPSQTQDEEPSETPDPIYIYHSEARQKKDVYEREKMVEEINKNIGVSVKSKLQGLFKKPFVKTGEGEESSKIIGIDEDKLAQSAALDGFFILQTNLDNTSLQQLYHYYHELWTIEQSFRMIKYNIALRPIFHYNVKRIKAHFAICYAAFVLVRTLEYRLKKNGCYLPLEQIHHLLCRVRIVHIKSADQTFQIAEDFPQPLIPIYNSLKIRPPTRFRLS
jgi:hypothetical protein